MDIKSFQVIYKNCELLEYLELPTTYEFTEKQLEKLKRKQPGESIRLNYHNYYISDVLFDLIKNYNGNNKKQIDQIIIKFN